MVVLNCSTVGAGTLVVVKTCFQLIPQVTVIILPSVMLLLMMKVFILVLLAMKVGIPVMIFSSPSLVRNGIYMIDVKLQYISYVCVVTICSLCLYHILYVCICT